MSDQLEDEQRDEVATPRSPSPSALSTASSASPLIRTNSSSLSSSLSSSSNSIQSSAAAAASNDQQHEIGSSGRNQSKSSILLKRPAPTSIAAAQLQQQQMNNSSIVAVANDLPSTMAAATTKAASSKLLNCNKLAHMTTATATTATPMRAQQQQQQQTVLGAGQANYRVASGKQQQKLKSLDEKKHKENDAKGFGYNYAKLFAYKASRFNEFWSVNKMRYMNLACLLMTLVCLFTILLFSKTSTTNHLDELQQQQQQANNFIGKLAGASTTRRRLDGGGGTGLDNELEKNTGDTNRSPLPESIDSIDRQPFVRLLSSASSSSKRNSLTNGNKDDADNETAGGDDDDLNRDENKNSDAMAASQTNGGDGFNLFDDKHDGAPDNGATNHLSSSSSSSSFDDLIDDARRQLKRQQKNEREMEETTTTTTTASSLPDPFMKGHHHHHHHARPVATRLEPTILGQVFHDLDNFGLFKAIKSQLLTGQSANFTQLSKPIVRRSKNGATIIMSFGNSNLLSPQSKVNSSSVSADASVNSNSSTQAIGAQGLLDKLLSPMLRPSIPLGSLLSVASDLDSQLAQPESTGKSGPIGFATITINSEPIIRGPFMSASAPLPLSRSPLSALMSPFGPFSLSSSGPFNQAIISKSTSPFSTPLFGAQPHSSSLVNPFANFIDARPASLFGPSSPVSQQNGASNGLLNMILRASSDFADQMEQLNLQQQQQQQQQSSMANSLNKANSTTAGNSSTSSNSNDTLNSQASQVVDSKQLIAPLDGKNKTTDSTGSNNTAASLDQEVETFDVGQLMSSLGGGAAAAATRHRQHPFMRHSRFGLPLLPMRSIYSSSSSSSSLKRSPADSMIMISSSSSAPSSIFQAPGGSSPFALPPLPPFVFPHSIDDDDDSSQAPQVMSQVIGGAGPQMFVFGGGSGSGRDRDGRQQPMSPIMRAMLGGIMSSLSDRGNTNNNNSERDTPPQASSSSSSQTSRRADDPELMPSLSRYNGDEWEERDSTSSLGGGSSSSTSRLRPFNHQMVSPLDSDLDGGQPNEALDFPPLVAFSSAPRGESASSILEQMLESSSSSSSLAGGSPIRRVSGSIKQIFRGPGVTVERIIELPASSRQNQPPNLRTFDSSPASGVNIESVDRGVRSQSISRMDLDQSSPGTSGGSGDEDDSDSRPVHQQHQQQRLPATFEDNVGELVRSMSAPASPPANSLIGRLFNDLSGHNQHQLDSLSNNLPKNNNRQQRAFDRSSLDGDDDGPTSISNNGNSNNENDDDEDESSGNGNSVGQQDQPASMIASRNSDSNSNAARNLHSWSPKIRLASSARVRVSPRVDSSLPSRFSLPAGPPTGQEMSQLAAAAAAAAASQMHSNNNNDKAQIGSSFTSPNSPLFGFPAMKLPLSSASGGGAGPTPAAAAAAASNQYNQPQQDISNRLRSSETNHAETVRSAHRPFVYHSNHEIASGQQQSSAIQQQQQQGRSSEQHQQQPMGGESSSSAAASHYLDRSAPSLATANLPAAIGMGRRLDEDELIS